MTTNRDVDDSGVIDLFAIQRAAQERHAREEAERGSGPPPVYVSDSPIDLDPDFAAVRPWRRVMQQPKRWAIGGTGLLAALGLAVAMGSSSSSTSSSAAAPIVVVANPNVPGTPPPSVAPEPAPVASPTPPTHAAVEPRPVKVNRPTKARPPQIKLTKVRSAGTGS